MQPSTVTATPSFDPYAFDNRPSNRVWPAGTVAGTTIGVQFAPVIEYDRATSEQTGFVSLSANPSFVNFSVEEIRVIDYAARIENPFTMTSNTQTTKLFGSQGVIRTGNTATGTAPTVSISQATINTLSKPNPFNLGTNGFAALNTQPNSASTSQAGVNSIGPLFPGLNSKPATNTASSSNGSASLFNFINSQLPIGAALQIPTTNPGIPITKKQPSQPVPAPKSKLTVPARRVWDAPPENSDSEEADNDENQLKTSRYGKSSKEFMKELSELHATGVQREIDLPQIAVVGSQSVGKSSLIESMAGIKLPRDSGTCTRCPMEILLQSASTWSCQVVLRFHAKDDGEPLDAIREVKFGDTLTDKVLVRERIRRAQKAILNPNKDPSFFLQEESNPPAAQPTLSFSFNCVCIRVAGPELPNLYFYDLPGVIANVRDGGDEKDIERTKEIALQYITRRNCLILLAISCETDYENQSAGRLVLLDPELRAKTIGVLTKADRIEAAAGKKWINMIEGKENVLPMKWFVVKQPNPRELQSGISWEDSRANEEAYFSQNKPWSAMAGAKRDQLGSQQLSIKLGEHLCNLLAKELPGIKSDITGLLNDVNNQLRALPRPVTDPHQQVTDLLTEFSQEMNRHVQGRWQVELGDELGLIQSLREVYDEFQRSVAGTAPCMRPWKQGEARANEAQLERSASELEDGILGAEGDVFYLNEVLELAAKSRTRELPGNTPFEVKAHLIRSFTDKWESICQGCFDDAESLMAQRLNILVSSHFRQYTYTGLLDAIIINAQQYLTELGIKTRTLIENLLELEKLPNTLNAHYFHDYKRKMASKYDELYQQSQQTAGIAASGNPDEALNQIVQVLKNQSGYENVVLDDLKNIKISNNEASSGVEIMAEVRAYFQVAYKRICDNVMLQIDRTLVREFGENLRQELFERLGIFKENAREVCADWLAEDPITVERRKDLLSRQSMLSKASRRLQRFSV